jgi:diaminopimelate decarboxylase
MTSTREAAPAADVALDLRPYEAQRDGASPNRNLTPLTTALDPEGRLVVGGCVLSHLARRYGTPLYVIDEATLRGTAQAYRKALASHYPGSALALYASKANSSLAITAVVASEGLGLDAVSAGELLTAVQGGMPPERIVFHGNNKSLEELRDGGGRQLARHRAAGQPGALPSRAPDAALHPRD